ncbi:aromatic compound dioxygenase [Penicillium samsonianum]|uniref:aromatic compound dioxygenase n=1 Tax=Penicillium samsonianum TaxID=1882272 RepID=UPI00254840D8|nr:aromatic compound dioxygenase [Penicillium samsonianum]KAJ6139320.1 aromatic compound dioxygenase [Penicillium samsonianum]
MFLADLWRLSFIGIAIPLAIAHPEEHPAVETQERAFQNSAHCSLKMCIEKLGSSGHNARSDARRRSLSSHGTDTILTSPTYIGEERNRRNEKQERREVDKMFMVEK